MTSSPALQASNARRVDDLTLIIEAAQRGDAGAADRLIETVYDELRRLASARLARERDNRTLQPTALVHEAWLRLGGDQPTAWKSRAHFFGAAAEAMRRILVDRARRRRRIRHGENARPVTLDGEFPASETNAGRLIEVDEALERLSAEAPEHAELVKLRYFVGLPLAEAAQILGISESTAKRRWAFARAWLLREVTH